MSEKIKMVIVQHAHGVSPQFFKIKTRVPNHNKYFEIKQFSDEDIKQKIFLPLFFKSSFSSINEISPFARKSGC